MSDRIRGNGSFVRFLPAVKGVVAKKASQIRRMKVYSALSLHKSNCDISNAPTQLTVI